MRIDPFHLSLQKGNFKWFRSLQHVNNLYSLEQLKIRMAIEKRRSERTSYQSSIIFFNAKQLLQSPDGQNKIPIDEVTRLICATVRATDMVSIYKNPTLLILLADTNSFGAQCASKRIVNKIMHRYASFGSWTYNDFHIKILSFPESKIDAVDPNGHASRKSAPQRRHQPSYLRVMNKMTFKQDYHENPNLCISSFNGSVIPLRIEESFFWDLELVSKYLLIGKKLTKRTADLIGALTAIFLFSPILGAIAIAIKLTSPGPILFRQTRVGYKGNHFAFFKFRSMVVNNENQAHQEYVRKLINGEVEQLNTGTAQNPCYKITDDPRITPLGRFLRKTSLDELPQFFNVLHGEMSLVGPRPPIPYEVTEYKKWHYRRILDVKPGITGLWQVSGRNRLSFDEMVRLDIRYAETWSFWMDLRILFKTFKVVFTADGK